MYYPVTHTYYHRLLPNKRFSCPVLVHVHYFTLERFHSFDGGNLWLAVWSSANHDVVKCFNFFMICFVLTDVYSPSKYQTRRNILLIKCIRVYISCGDCIVNKKNKKVLLREHKRHTDRGVSSTPFVTRGGVPPPQQGYPPPARSDGGLPKVGYPSGRGPPARSAGGYPRWGHPPTGVPLGQV